jgi:hypothetical protein
MSKEVYLIGCHVQNTKQLFLLTRLVDVLVQNEKEFILVSHTTIPETIVQKSVAFIYDRENPTFKSWDLQGSNHWNFQTENWRIASKYILHGASDYYHVGTLRLLLNGIKYIQSTEYDVVHWIEYDTLPDFQRALLNTGLINEGDDFVFHGLGAFFSFNARAKMKEHFVNADSNILLKLLQKNSYVAEIVIMNEIFEQEAQKIYDVLPNGGDFSQNYDNIPVHWSLFTESNNDLHIFLLNKQNKTIQVTYKYNDRTFFKELTPDIYSKNKIGEYNLDGHSLFEIVVDGKVHFKANWNGQEFYDKLIKETRTWNDV